jgi:hypothetical protein
MKKMKLWIGLIVFSLLVLTGSRVHAFPLTLTSLSGTITATPHYGIDAASTSNAPSKVTITINQVITVLSNEVFLDLGTSAPPDMRIAMDPYTGGMYLTNTTGFFYDIERNGLGTFRIREIATKFSSSASGLPEEDLMVLSLGFNGRAPNGTDFDFELRGATTFQYQVDKSGVGTIVLAGKKMSGSGQFNTSDSGVSQGSFVAKGSGVAEWTGPFSVYWWNNF